MYSKTFLLSCIIGLSFACTAPKLVPHPSATIHRLGICVEYDPMMPQTFQSLFDRQLQDFIIRYNSDNPRFLLETCADPEVESLRLYISGTKLVGSGRQTAGIVLSAVGLTLPFVLVTSGLPAYAGFCYFPQNISKVKLSLSDDISAMEDHWTKRMFFNPAFLMTMQKQLYRHTQKFDWFLENTLVELEHSYQKHHRKEVPGFISKAAPKTQP